MLKTFILILIVYAQFAFSGCITRQGFVSPAIEDFDCHGASLVETEPGIFLAVWKGAYGKGNINEDLKQEIAVWLSRYENGSWNSPEKIVHNHETIWSPTLVNLPGAIALFYRQGPFPWQVIGLVKYSFDHGMTWSEEQILPAGILGPIRSKANLDAEGNILFGSSVESGSSTGEYKAAACWIDVLLKDWQSWKKYGPIALQNQPFGVIEPVLFRDCENNLRLVCRDRTHKVGGEGWVQTAVSKDEGKTWSALQKTNLPNPDSGIDIVDLGKGALLLFYNHSHTNRYPLNVALSSDGGNSWQSVMILDTVGEIPNAVLASDGKVHLLYTWKSKDMTQRRIKHVVLDPTQCFID